MKNAINLLMVIISLECFVIDSNGTTIKMSTTTSTQASGLLDYLLPVFEKESGIKVHVLSKGTGAAIRDGMDGNVDVIMVHAIEREEEFVRLGYGTKRYPLMHNSFIIIGHSSDKAKIKGLNSAAKAFYNIAKTSSMFVSRGDDSGTHIKEQFIWKNSGIKLVDSSKTIYKKGKKKDVKFVIPEKSEKWYMSIGQGMGKVLTFADEKNSYTLSDTGTYIKFKYSNKPAINLDILCQGDPILYNPYSIIPVNPKKYSDVKYDSVMKFVNWLISKKGQSLIANYRLSGKQLFYPDVVK